MTDDVADIRALYKEVPNLKQKIKKNGVDALPEVKDYLIKVNEKLKNISSQIEKNQVPVDQYPLIMELIMGRVEDCVIAAPSFDYGRPPRNTLDDLAIKIVLSTRTKGIGDYVRKMRDQSKERISILYDKLGEMWRSGDLKPEKEGIDPSELEEFVTAQQNYNPYMREYKNQIKILEQKLKLKTN